MDLQGTIGIVLFALGAFLQYMVALTLISLLNPGQQPMMILLLTAGLFAEIGGLAAIAMRD